MQISQVRVVRRLLVGLIVVVSIAIFVNYFQSRRRRSEKIGPEAQILGPEMLRSAENLQRTANKDGVTKFRLRALKLLETRQGREYLQGIDAVDLNPDGSINNQMTSKTGWYDPALNKVYFSGDVRLKLGKNISLQMQSLHYDHGAQTGYSDDRLQLESPQVRGTARGFRYDNARKNLELMHELDFEMNRSVPNADGSMRSEEYHLSAQHGFYLEAESAINLDGAARLTSEGGMLGGDVIHAEFVGDTKRLSSLSSQGNAVYRSVDKFEERIIRGDRLEFGIGQVSKGLEFVRVLKSASMFHKSPSGSLKLTGEEIQLDLEPVKGSLKMVRSDVGVFCELTRGSQTTNIRGDSLAARFIEGSSSPESLQVNGDAVMSTGTGGAASGSLKAEGIGISFRDQNGRATPTEVRADNSVRWSLPGRNAADGKATPAQTLTAASLRMHYSQAGEWLESGTATGAVRLEAAPDAGRQDAALRRLQSDRMLFRFFPGNDRLEELRGDGNVQVFYQSARASAAGRAAEAFHTSSSNIVAKFLKAEGDVESVVQSGSFVYRDATRTANAGSCEFTAASQMLVLREQPIINDNDLSTSGDTVRLDRQQKILYVEGHVRSVLKAVRGDSQNILTASRESAAPSIVTADAMTYWSAQDQVHYAGHINLLSANSFLQSESLDIFNRGEKIEAAGAIRHVILGFAEPRPAKAGADPAVKGVMTGNQPRSGSQATIRSARLQYARSANRLHYAGEVLLDSSGATLKADAMDVFLDQEGRKAERGYATGHLVIIQPNREVRGTAADYILSEGKFSVVGDLAELKDYGKITTRAPRLTFYISDDRIVSGIR